MKLGLLGWTHIYVGKQDLDGVVINIGAAPLKGLIRVEDADRAASAPKTPYRVTLTPIDSPSYIAPFMQTTAAVIPTALLRSSVYLMAGSSPK